MPAREYSNNNRLSEYSNCYQWVKSLQNPPIEGLIKSKQATKCDRVVDEWSLCPNMKHRRHVYQPDHFAGGCLMSLSPEDEATIPRDFVLLGPGQTERLSLGAQMYVHRKENHSPPVKSSHNEKKRRKHAHQKKSGSIKRGKSPQNYNMETNSPIRSEDSGKLLSEYRQSYVHPPWKSIVSSEMGERGNTLLYQIPTRGKPSPPKDNGVLPTSNDEKVEDIYLDSNRTMRSEYSDKFTAFKSPTRIQHESKNIPIFEPLESHKGHYNLNDRESVASETSCVDKKSSENVLLSQNSNHLLWLEDLLRRRRLAKEYRERSFSSHIWWSDVSEDDETVSTLNESIEGERELVPDKKIQSSAQHKNRSNNSVSSLSSRQSEKSDKIDRQASWEPAVAKDMNRNSRGKQFNEFSPSSASSDVSSSVTLTSSHGLNSVNNLNRQPSIHSEHLLPRSDMKWMTYDRNKQSKHRYDYSSKSNSHMTKVQHTQPRLGAFVAC